VGFDPSWARQGSYAIHSRINRHINIAALCLLPSALPEGL